MSHATIVALGELLVEFVSHRRGCALRELTEYSGPYPSGAPAIFIEQAARMGARTQLFGSVGADSFGQVLLDRLESSAVDTSGILRQRNKTTGVAFVSYFEDGRRIFVFHLDNTATDAVPPACFTLPDAPVLMHVSGSSLANPALRTAILKTVSAVIEHGGELSCDPNARAELMQDPQLRGVLEDIIARSHYLFPSTSDLEFLFPGASEQEALQHLHTGQARIVALKRGAQGCTVASAGSSLTLAGHQVTELDPTGAGDCFCGTFLAMHSAGHSLVDCARYANAAGALSVTRRGPMEGNSDTAAVQDFLDSNPLEPELSGP